MAKKAKLSYFGKHIQDAIIRYNDAKTQEEKDKEYILIYPALNKLVENIIHNRKLYEYGTENYLSTRLDCVCYLTERLHKFEFDKGKAFSYFNRAAINFLVDRKRKVENVKYQYNDVQHIDTERNISNEISRENYVSDLSDFCQKWSEWGIKNIDMLFDKKRDKRIGEAIFNLFKNVDQIHNYNKKAIYIMIREQVDVKTQFITNVMGTLKELQSEMYIEFLNSGTRKWKYFLIKDD